MPRQPSPRLPSQVDPVSDRRRAKKYSSQRTLGLPRWGWVILLIGLTGLFTILGMFQPPDLERLRAQAEDAVQSHDWGSALALWRQINKSPQASAETLLAEGRASLVLGLAGQAEQALRRAITINPKEIDAWLLLLKILRLEDRLVELDHLGWTADLCCHA